MKKIILIINLLLATLCSTYGLEVVWENQLEAGVDPTSMLFKVATGTDGSLIIVFDDDLYWYGSNGNLQTTIFGLTGTGNTYIDSQYVNETEIILDMNDVIKVITKTESSYAIENIPNSIWQYGRKNTLSGSTPYFPVVNDDTITVYRLPSDNTSTTSSGISFVPNNAVVIPSSYTGSVDVILETSEDLVNWTPASSGRYGPNVSSRFFRVRATTAE
jgi:hypothetical protein